MRVLYDNEIFLIQKYGGATRYFYELIKRMPALKAEVILYMGKFINEYGLEKYADSFNIFSGTKVRHIPRTKLISIKIQKPLFERFAVRQDFNLIHQTYFGDINISKDFKRVITVHDFTHERLSSNFSSLDRTAELKKLAVKKADGIICVSESTKNDLLERYDTKGKKIKVIYHGNSLKYDVTEERIIKDKYLLYVGDRRSYKNFGILIKVFEMNEALRSEYKVVCCGGGKFTKGETEKMAEANVLNNFTQTEARDRTIANLYFYAKAFVYPSKYEGFGIPMIEAMYNGCPIIASNVSSLPEVGGESALYFNPDSPEELKEQINVILNNKEKVERMISSGKERERMFSWNTCAEETYKFYEEVTG
ncbi:MAG: glycosyltransferase family 1 protein [Ignavibacteriota bacterium]|nr:glycosyltransferase family 1 protein [Ignavibacteriota bacterium]